MTVRVGVLSDETMPRWLLQDLENAVKETDVKITLAIIDETESKDTEGYIIEALKDDLWGKYNKLSWKLNPPELGESVPIKNNSLFTEADFHYCKPVPADDIGNTLPTEAIKLAAKNCDVLLRSGFGIIQGKILTCTKYGVLSYHHGDIREYRGKPAGFWEYMNGDAVSGVTLQRLNETLDGGEIVVFKEVDISGLRTWREVQNKLYTTTSGMLSIAIERLTDSSFNPSKVDELGDLYTNPTNTQMLKFFIKIFINI